MEIIFNNVCLDISNNSLLHNINFSINTGEINLIYGKSGSGKTTLIETLYGYNKPTNGSIIIDKKIVNLNSKKELKSIRQNIGILFQFCEEQLFNNTVYDEITFNFAKKITKEDGFNELLAQNLDFFSLPKNFLTKKINDLSNSEKRKVCLINLLLNDYDTIILDEPTISLDDNDRLLFLKIIKKLKELNKTIIIVSHDIDLFYNLFDKIIVLNKGCNVFTGNKSGLIKHCGVLEYYDIYIPALIDISYKAEKIKNIKLGYYENNYDLMKDIYRNV